MAKSYYDLEVEELSQLIGNKNKAQDIYNTTGSWDSPGISQYSQANDAIRKNYGLSDDADLNTLNNIFNQKLSEYNSNSSSNGISSNNSSNKPLINTGNSASTYTGQAKNTNNLNIYESEFRPVQRATVSNGYDMIYGDGAKGFLSGLADNELVKGLQQNYYDEGEKAYKSNIAGINSYSGGKNTWSERIAADARNDYNKAAANVVPQYAQMYLGAMNDYNNRIDNLDVTDNQYYQYAQNRSDQQTQQKFANDYAVSEMMGGATYGLRASQNPYLNTDGTVNNSYIDQDFGTMIANLDPNDPAYQQKRYQLEQARFAKVQDPRYAQYASGVVAPVSASPIYSANPNNPTNQAQIISNQLLSEYGPQEYQANIAAKNLANQSQGMQNDVYSQFAVPNAQLEYDSAKQQYDWYPKIAQSEINSRNTNAAANMMNASKTSSANTGGLTAYQQLQAGNKKLDTYSDQLMKLYYSKDTDYMSPTYGQTSFNNAGAEQYVQGLLDKGLITNNEAIELAGRFNLKVEEPKASKYDNEILAGH